MNQQNADYQSGFLAGMEYQERVEVDLLEALKLMEARFGCLSSRAEEQPKTYACHHTAETCTNCEGLVSGWKAVQAARAAIAKATGEQK